MRPFSIRPYSDSFKSDAVYKIEKNFKLIPSHLCEPVKSSPSDLKLQSTPTISGHTNLFDIANAQDSQFIKQL